MEDFDVSELKRVGQIRKEKREKIALPVSKAAQKEFIRDWLSRSQDKFEECMEQLAEYDPKAFATIYMNLSKHMIPKQSEVSVTHGLDQDFKELMALSTTKIEGKEVVGISSIPEIHDADFEELEGLGNGNS